MKKVATLERSTWQRLESNLQPIARKDLQPSVKQSSGNWILPATWMSLEVDPSQLSFHMRPQASAGNFISVLQGTLKQRNQLSYAKLLTTETVS